MRVFYDPAYVNAAFEFDTTRKAQWVADSLAADPVPHLTLEPPPALTEADVAAVHDPGYVRAVRTGRPRALAESQGFDWDRGLWPAVLASNGGVVAAALAALREGVAGTLSSGIHHAGRGSGGGFCTFNGLALAARAARLAGARSVLVLDLDAHCGGGTASLIADDPAVKQVDVAVRSYDSYDPSEQSSLTIVGGASGYLPVIESRLNELRHQPFDLCLYYPGMDPHEDCPTGGTRGITTAVLAERERMVFEWCRAKALPVAFALGGGYVGPRLDVSGLVALHRLTLAAAVAALR